MKPTRFSPALAGVLAVTLAPVALAPVALADDLALKRVMLSTGGVGYLEYSADVQGAAALRFDVRLDQVDDVLKSLVVFDAAGSVAGLELPSRDQPDAAFAALPFGPDALASPLDYLNSLAGVTLTIAGPRPMTGRLLKAEKVVVAGKPPASEERTRVSLMTDEGLRQFVLEDADAVQVTDPALRARIATALASLRHDAGATLRHITLHTAGNGAASRQVRVGYVAAAPLWKTSYRLVLPPTGAAKARLQGWAVLENTTGADWAGVELALQYGNPVTFRQAIYSTYHVQRPEVPVEILGRLLPDVDQRANALADAAPPPMAPMAPMPVMSAPAPAAMAKMERPMPMMAPPAETTQASEGSQETVFVLPGKVTLASGSTASVPILDREVTATRVGLVQPNRPHPLASVRVVNDTATSLPAGVLTLYDPASPAAFAGDARLGGLPAGQTRLLSFAEDLRTGATWQTTQATTIAAVTAAAGVLRVDQRLRFSSAVTLVAPAQEARALLVEIPRQPGATLAPDNADEPVQDTATAWRFAVTLAAGETRILRVASERVTRQQTGLLEDDTVVARLLGQQDLGAPARTALQGLVDLRTRKAAATAETARLKLLIDQLGEDEGRTRANLAAVPANDALHTRLVRQLEAQDGRIDTLRKSLDQATAAVDQAQRDLVAAVGRFSL